MRLKLLYRACMCGLTALLLGRHADSAWAQMIAACGSNTSAPICRIARDWTVVEVEALLDGESSRVIADQDTEEITFVYHGAASQVRLCCGIQHDLSRAEESDYWALTLQIRDLAQAVISYQFVPTPMPDTGIPVLPAVWRGSNAPPPVAQVELLSGTLEDHILDSAAIGETRSLTVYLPPQHDSAGVYPVMYTADGQSTPIFAQVVEPLILAGDIPPLIIVGVHSAQGRANRATRADEYLPPGTRGSFDAHETFFTEEVRAWAEAALGASGERDQRIVFGFSNGGVFAVAMGYHHPDLYGHVFGFSLGVSPGALNLDAEVQSRYYLAAGKLEASFAAQTRSVATYLQQHAVEVVEVQRISGHDFVMWLEELPNALRWADLSR